MALLGACKPDAPKSIGPRYSTVAGTDGDWKINKVEVIDESSPLKLSRDLTDYFSEEAPNFNINFDVAAKTFEVQEPGSGVNFFGNSGVLDFDDEQYPTKMWLINGGDTVTLNFARQTRAIDPEMVVNYTRSACDKVYANYKFTFLRN
jgi:hypothetical protein